MIVDFNNLSLGKNKTLPYIRTDSVLDNFKHIEIRNFKANKGLDCKQFKELYSMGGDVTSLKLVNVGLSKTKSHTSLFNGLAFTRLEFENVTGYGKALYNKYFSYTSIGEIVVDQFDLIGAVGLDSMFDNSSIKPLDNLNIGEWDTKYVYGASWCFLALRQKHLT